MRQVRSVLVLGAALGAAACATTHAVPHGDGVARLEQARAAHPGSENVLRSLGIAYFEAGRYRSARATLDTATRRAPDDGIAALYLGMSAERLGDLTTAQAAYATYLRVGHTRRVRYELEAHLASLSRREMRLSARSAIREEHELGATPGSPTTVAVMPLAFTGTDSSLAPLRRGLEELLVTDLSHCSEITVVERDRIQALLDELRLQHAGATRASTNVQAGRILQAGRLVEGSIVQQGDQLRVDAAVVNVPTTEVAGSATDQRALDQLMTLEKNVAFGILDAMHVVPTTAERDAIEQRPTKSLQAFLAYSRGLTLEDDGRYDEAAHMFDQAGQLDPSFNAARQESAQSRTLSSGSSVTTQTVESSLAAPEARVVRAAVDGAVVVPAATTAATLADEVNPNQAADATRGNSGHGSRATDKNGFASGTGNDNPTGHTAKITVIVHEPGH